MGTPTGEFFDQFAGRVANRYWRGEYSWEFADAAMNELFAYAYVRSNSGLSSFAWAVFSAFDEGEYIHAGANGEERTLALLEPLIGSTAGTSHDEARAIHHVRAADANDCRCQTMPKALLVADQPANWVDTLEHVESDNWNILRSCKGCRQLWSVELFDRLQPQVAIRVTERGRWLEEGECVDTRKQLLLQSRGGTQVEPCAWLACSDEPVVGVAYCLNHLWQTGARR